MLVVQEIVSLEQMLHQLYVNPISHGIIRVAGIELLREKRKDLLKSNFEHSWIQYLVSMTCQATWADSIIKQAVWQMYLI